MRVIATIVLVFVLAWMLVNYVDNQPKQRPRPVETDLTEPGAPEAVLQSSDRRYYSPIDKAKNTENVLMEGVDKKREQIEAAAQ